MSDKACYSSENCRVKAYYVKNEGIFYRDNLLPDGNICDLSIILHEMVHHYQKNSNRTLISMKGHYGLYRKDKLCIIKIYFSSHKKDLIITKAGKCSSV